MAIKFDFRVLKLLHDVDIVLGINWLETVPLNYWCNGKMYLPNAMHTALLGGSWLDQKFRIGTVKPVSTHDGLKQIKNVYVESKLATIASPKF